MSKDNLNHALIRSYVIKQQTALRLYISSLPDSRPIIERMAGKDNGRKFAFQMADLTMAQLGYPVTSDSSNEKAWAAVFG